MKTKLLFPAALAALALLSCNRETVPAEDGQPVRINVSIVGTAPTRATGASATNESHVSNLQLFVFNGDNLEDYVDAGSATSVQLTATSGERTLWAVVNAAPITGISKPSDLSGKTSLLSENAPNALVMAGSVTQNLQDNATITIPVTRIVAKVAVNKISTDFQNALASETLTIDGIYLINVAADNNYAGNKTPEQWVNKLGHTDSGVDALLYDSVNKTVRNNSPYQTAHTFYPYPNPTTATSHEGTWSIRHSMLVVEVTLQGQKGYYPIEMPVLERNKTYIIEELILKHRPGDKPYKPIETGDASVTVTVQTWEQGQLWTKLEL
jgi:hypothetical protein